MSKYEEARQLAINSLENALDAHKNNDLLSIENGFEKYEGLVSESNVPANSLLYLTLEFWAGWSDSAIHNWLFYEPLKKDDWPRLAVIILEALKENKEITNPVILESFRVKPKTSLITKLKGLFGGKTI